jgi:hypothetical protein
MQVLAGQRGFVSFKVLIVLVLLFAVVHVGIKLVPMYMDAERMKDEMAVKARLAQQLKDEEIMTDLVNKAKELDLPLGTEDFTLARDDASRKMHIIAAWDVEVTFFWGVYVRNYHFAPDIEEGYSRHF